MWAACRDQSFTAAATRFIFDTDDSNLCFDKNGSAAGGRTLIAHCDNGYAVTFPDIIIV